jgi:hypothetical protein
VTDFETKHHVRENTRPAADSYFGLAAAGVTWVLCLYRVGPSALWENDYRVVQCLSQKAIGWDGILTAVIGRATRLVPLGTYVTRLSLVSALAASVCAWLIYSITVSIFAPSAPPKPIDRWLSFGTALLFSVSHSVQYAATIPPGPLVAVAVVLGCIRLVLSIVSREELAGDSLRSFFLLGWLVAITLLESSTLFVFALVVIAFQWLSFRRRLSRSSLNVGLLGAAACFVTLGIPWVLTRQKALTLALGSTDLPSSFSVAWWQWAPSFPDPVGRDLGPITLSLALFGIASVVFSKARRRLFWIFVLVVPSAFLTRKSLGLAGPDGIRFFGLFGLLVLSSHGLARAIEWSARGRKSPRLLAQFLAVIIQMTLVLAHGDESSYSIHRYLSHGIDVFTDEAIATLPLRSVVLVQDPRFYRRFLAASLASGVRPDLLVIPLDAATHQAVVADLLPREPALAPVLRELTINGRPSEFALSTLADERPVFVEFDSNWDRRLREHLLPLPFLSRLYSQALGRSDRARALEVSRQQIASVLNATTAPEVADSAAQGDASIDKTTREMAQVRIEEQLTILLDLDDRQLFDSLLREYEKFIPKGAWMERIRAQSSRSVKANDLPDTTISPPRR